MINPIIKDTVGVYRFNIIKNQKIFQYLEQLFEFSIKISALFPDVFRENEYMAVLKRANVQWILRHSKRKELMCPGTIE